MSSTIEISRSKGKYLYALARSVKRYEVSDSACLQPLAEVVNKAAELSDELQIDPQAVGCPPRGIHILAVANEWLKTDLILCNDSLYDFLKYLSIGFSDGKWSTRSQKVRQLSSSGQLEWAIYDPEAPTRRQYNVYDSSWAYFDKYHDPKLSGELQQMLEDTSMGSYLSPVRRKLKIKRRSERPYQVWALTRTATEMSTDLSCTGRFTYREGQPFLVVNSDFTRWDSLQHEYVHSQCPGINYGYDAKIFSGVGEALTESVRPTPVTYPGQRQVVEFIKSSSSCPDQVEVQLLRAHKYILTAVDKVIADLIQRFGLRGLLYIALLSPKDGGNYSDPISASIFRDPFDIYYILQKPTFLTADSRMHGNHYLTANNS